MLLLLLEKVLMQQQILLLHWVKQQMQGQKVLLL